MAGLYMRLHQFAREVSDLEPPWASTRHSLAKILRRFDEAGVLRPVLRIDLPEGFAKFEHQNPHIRDADFTTDQIDDFTAILDALGELRTTHVDALREQLEDIDSVLTSHLIESTPDETVRWDDWMVTVDETEDGRTVSRPHVLSVYGSWQKIQCWFAIEAYSFRGLLDPSRIHPREVFERGWELSLGEELLKCTTGNGRALRAFHETNAENWLQKLYAFRTDMKTARFRLHDPHNAGWDEGRDLSFDDREEIVDTELTRRAEELGAPWLEGEDDFCERVSSLLELVGHAEDLHSPELVDVLHDDLWTAIDWSYYLYSHGFWELNEMVEPAGRYRRKTLHSELRPNWHEARRSAERFLRQLVDNDALHQQLSLSEEGLEQFVGFLADQGLEAWMLELSQVSEEFSHPTDASLERRFLHLRSQAILTETVIMSLAEQFGAEGDLEDVNDRRTKRTYRAFLLGPGRPGWRNSVWQCLSEKWNLTQASDAEELSDNLEDLLDSSAPLCPGTPEHDPVCRAILTAVAFRHYGAHHFTRDRTLLVRNLGHLMGSVAQTAVFYWNQASSDA